jgi:aromatic-L-amino-acid decarboxylase
MGARGRNSVGVLAEMLAGSLNANLGGRDHIPIEVERQIVRWMQTLFGFPESTTGLFVTGTSIANFIGVLIARDVALGFETRSAGVAANSRRLAAYATSAVHTFVAIGREAQPRLTTGFVGYHGEVARLKPF